MALTALVLSAPAGSRAQPSVAAADPAAVQMPIKTDLPTVISIGVTTYFLTSLIHEGLGHVGGCILGGGRPRGFSTTVGGCYDDISPAGKRVEAAGGAVANLLVGSSAALTLALSPPSGGPEYYFLWLTSAVNLFQAAGYLMVGPWVPVGDFGKEGVLKDVTPRLPWQIGLSATGLAMTFGTVFLANWLSRPLLGDEPGTRNSRRWTLTLWPYLVGSTFISASGLLSREGPEYAISAAVANFAGTLFLAYIPIFFGSDAFYPGEPALGPALPIQRSTPWLIAGAASLVLGLAVFGPGLGDFSSKHPLDPS